MYASRGRSGGMFGVQKALDKVYDCQIICWIEIMTDIPQIPVTLPKFRAWSRLQTAVDHWICIGITSSYGGSYLPHTNSTRDRSVHGIVDVLITISNSKSQNKSYQSYSGVSNWEITNYKQLFGEAFFQSCQIPNAIEGRWPIDRLNTGRSAKIQWCT